MVSDKHKDSETPCRTDCLWAPRPGLVKLVPPLLRQTQNAACKALQVNLSGLGVPIPVILF